jgi:hypothetical protein
MKSGLNQDKRTGTAGGAEETLRVIANLPAPEGLVDRVQTRLRSAPRSALVLSWPSVFGPGGWGYAPALRGAAAAAIVCGVVGGGWRIYSHVQPAASARVITMPAPAIPGRGFSTAGSVHTPDPRPVVTHMGEGAAGPSAKQESSGPSKSGNLKKAAKRKGSVQ